MDTVKCYIKSCIKSKTPRVRLQLSLKLTYVLVFSAALNCASFEWNVTNSSIEAAVNGCTHVTAQNSTGSGKNGTVNNNRVNLQDLYPGGSYNVSLFYDLESEQLLQCSHRLILGEFTCAVWIVLLIS